MSATVTVVQEGSSPVPSFLLASTLSRRIPVELRKVQEELTQERAKVDTDLIRALQKWHDDFSLELKDRKKDPILALKDFQVELENLLEDPIRDAFAKPLERVAELFIDRLTKDGALFFSERVREAAKAASLRRAIFDELRAVEEELRNADHTLSFVQCVQIWVDRSQDMLKETRLDPKACVAFFREEVENLLKDPRTDTIPLKYFSDQAAPIEQFLIQRMTQKKSLLFSNLAVETLMKARALERRRKTQEKLMQIDLLHQENLALERAALERFQAVERSVQQLGKDSSEQLVNIGEASRRSFAGMEEQLEALRLRAETLLQQRREKAAARQKEINELQQRLDGIDQKQAVLATRIGALEREKASLELNVLKLRQEIENKKDGWLGSLVLHVGIAFLTWGASNAFQAAFQFTKVGPGITWAI